MDSICFELTKPFTYANGKGDEIECSFIELVEPTGKVTHICCAVEGLIQSSLVRMSDLLDADTIEHAKETAAEQAKVDTADEEKDGDGILALMVGGGADMGKIVAHFRELFKIVALMGGEKAITSARLDDMTHADLRRMIGVYAANFILN